MSGTYRCLSQQEFTSGIYKLIPIRNKDKYVIMNWRNEQIDILRQTEILTKRKQKLYFENIVKQLFEKDKPNQLLFSFLENNVLIGYGGLVHIDWESKNGEISFLTNTNRNIALNPFNQDFTAFLNILMMISFDLLNFIKVYTTVYKTDGRKMYIKVLEKYNFIKEGELKHHIAINDKMEDILVYSYFHK